MELWLPALLLAYLSGSIPFGLLIGKMRGVDLRQHGSGNIGATNAGRILGKKFGILCFVLDLLKGLLPPLIWGLWQPTDGLAAAGMWLALGAITVIGHVFPVWLKFRGGKGVATSLGMLLGFWPTLTLPALAAALVWLAVVNLSGLVGLASVSAALVLPPLVALVAWQLQAQSWWLFTAVAALLAALVIVKHRSNLRNWRAGTEPMTAWTWRARRAARASAAADASATPHN